MLRIHPSTSSGRAKSYYSTADYYTEGQELLGVWHGAGARLLGLGGTVQKEDWDALCDNLDPRSGKRLTPRTRRQRRVGYDFTFDVPKSVSVVYGLTHDERILDAFRGAVDQTMNDIQLDMKTRVREGGRDDDRLTGQMVWGQFIHTTGRPVEGVPDPQLHAHNFVMNATFDSKENKWKAGQFGDLKRDAPYYEALFHTRLATNLRGLGLDLTRNKKSWELSGIDKSVVDLFSRRTQLIEKLAKEQGITDVQEKSELGARTREGKAKHLTTQQLQAQWRGQMTDPQLDQVYQVIDRIGGNAIPDAEHAADAAIDHARSHCFERRSVLPKRVLLAEALRQSGATCNAEDILAAFDRGNFITGHRDGREVVTTPEVLAEEQRILKFAREGRGRCHPLGGNQPLDVAASFLNADQRAAVKHVLTSPDRVMLIRGGAGVGKTTMMAEAVKGIEAAGTKVFTFAPSADASRDTLRKSGFPDAETVAMLLTNPKIQEQIDGAVLWIDEAGQMGSETVDEVFALAEQKHCRVILSGDRRQHGSVARGAALRLLEEEAGLKPAEIREIMRQSGQYKQAIKSLSEGDVESGFRQLDELGWIHEVPDEERYRRLATDYVTSVSGGTETLVVCPTHHEGARVTAEIRRSLQATKQLGTDERELPVLKNANLTEAERADAVNYLPGDVVLFHQNAKGGYKKGSRLIAGRDVIPHDQAARFTVFHPDSLRVAKGDRIRITANGHTQSGADLFNGKLRTVTGFTRDGDLKLDNQEVLPRGFGNVAYGYVVTSHSSQSKSVPNVLVAQSAESFPASSQEQFYVSLSRGKRRAALYTDDKAKLLEAVSRSDERINATELLHDRDRAERVKRIVRNATAVKELAVTRQSSSERSRAPRELERAS